MQDAIAPDDHVRVLEQVLIGDIAEVALAGAEHDRGDVHRHLVDEVPATASPDLLAGGLRLRRAAEFYRSVGATRYAATAEHRLREEVVT